MLEQKISSYIHKSGILDKKNPLLVILGPTSSGKTRISIPIAKELHGEIISADSAQIYSGMDIGTAKITSSEMDGIKHHMIDIIQPDKRYSVGAFKKRTDQIIKEIYKRGNLPIIVGGTMLWIDSVIYNYQFPDVSIVDEDISDMTLEKMQTKLKKEDIKTYNSIDVKNKRRVERALSFVLQKNKSFVETRNKGKSRYNYLLIGLRWPREILYDRLNRRVDTQIKEGLLDEVRGIIQKYGKNSSGMQCISYKQMAKYLGGEINLEEAKNILRQANRNYAKRQMTWWRRNAEIKWFDCGQDLQ